MKMPYPRERLKSAVKAVQTLKNSEERPHESSEKEKPGVYNLAIRLWRAGREYR
jgi:hypothetical protein